MLSRQTIEAYLFFLLRHRVLVSLVVGVITLGLIAANGWRLSASALSNLWHLEGETITVNAEGATHPDVVVANGRAPLTDMHVHSLVVCTGAGSGLAGFSFLGDLSASPFGGGPIVRSGGRNSTRSPSTIPFLISMNSSL